MARSSAASSRSDSYHSGLAHCLVGTAGCRGGGLLNLRPLLQVLRTELQCISAVLALRVGWRHGIDPVAIGGAALPWNWEAKPDTVAAMSSRTRIVICGGGAIGAAIAYFTSRRGARPTVIERSEERRVGQGSRTRWQPTAT